MTVSSTTSSETFNCDGATVAFTCPFRALDSTDLRAYLITVSTGARVLLENGVDYTVTGAGTDANVVVTTVATYSNLYQIKCARSTARVQPIDYRDNDPFPAESHERGLDRAVMLAQEVDADVARSIRVPDGESIDDLPDAATRANKALVFDADGQPILSVPASGSAASLALILAGTANASEGSGAIGFLYSLAYGAGTVGKWLKDLALSTGASFIGWIQSGAGAVARTVQAKLRDWPSITDYGAVADGNYGTGAGTDNTAAIQAAINAMSTTGGGTLWVPGGILGTANSCFKVSSQITIPDGVTLQGAGKWSSILFCPTAFANTGGLVRLAGPTGNPTGFKGIGVLSQTGGCTGFGVVSVKNGVFIRDVWVSGFDAGVVLSSTDNFLDDFAVELCTTNIYITESDVNVSNGTVYQGTIGVQVGNTAAVGRGRVHITAVRATQQQQLAFAVVAGKAVTMAGCSASADSGGASFLTNAALLIDTASDVTVTGFSAMIGGTPSPTGVGIKCINGSNDITVSGSKATGFLDGFSESACTGVAITGNTFTGNGRSGIYMLNGDQVSSVGNRCYGNGSAGGTDAGIVSANGSANSIHSIIANICTEAGGGAQEYGINAGVTSTGYTAIVGNTALYNNTADINLTGTTGSIRLAQNTALIVTDTAPSVASAASLTLPVGADFIQVTGTTNITSITATGSARRQVTLYFTGALTVTDGSNLKLAGNFVTTGDDSITLYCDGTSFFEVSRSVN